LQINDIGNKIKQATENKMQKLIDVTDLKVREELEDYYIVSKSRIDNLISCFEGGAKRIQDLTKIIEEQQSEIARMTMLLVKEES
jgi:hypothetical protein